MKRGRVPLAVWVGLLYAGTALAAVWAALLGLMWGVLVADINPDNMPPLTERQQAVVVRVTRQALLAAAVPPIVVSAAWAVTAAVLLSLRRASPNTSRPVEPATPAGASA